MAQTFSASANVLARASLIAVPVVLAGLGWAAWELQNSSYVTGQDVVRSQPVPFSHEHHVRGLGIDCRYCHTTADRSPFAGMPSTQTCMTCHSQVWTNAQALEPVRQSWQTGRPIPWQRVHSLPAYVYFNHSIHVQKGVGCATCHGPVDRMPLLWQEAPLTMGWCLDCHRDPTPYLRPREEVYNMRYRPPADQQALGRELMRRYEVRPRAILEDCYTCHR